MNIMDNQNVKTRGRPRKYQGTLQERVAQAQATFQQARQIGRVNINAQTRGQAISGAINIIKRGRPSKKNQQLEQIVNKEVRQRNLNKSLFKPLLKRRLFFMKPTDGSFTSYNEYTIFNDYPEMIPMQHLTTDDALVFLVDDAEPPAIPEEQVERFLRFYRIENYLKTKTGHKAYVSIKFLTAIKAHGSFSIESRFVTSKSFLIRNEYDVYDIIESVMDIYKTFREQNYNFPFQLESLTVSVAKVNSLTGSSYIPLPDWISNKKACINIKNEDNLCFLYSVLCGINTPVKDPQRVTKYKR